MTSSSLAGRLLGPSGKARAGRLAEQVWRAGFSTLGLAARRPPPASPARDPYRRVLVVAPHPDDESIGCAGTLLLHKRAGAEVVVVCVTDGRTSRAHGIAPDEMARRRRLEADACARLLGIDRLEWLGLRGGAWQDEEWLQALETVMARHRPDLVYAPSRIDFHPEHRKVAFGLGRFWAAAAEKPQAVRIYPLQVPLTAALANMAVDVTEVMAPARAAMDAYATQLANMPRAIRQRRYAACRYRLGTYAEEFWQMSAEAYSRLHQESGSGGATRFRGVREHPIYDPLAYLAGARLRQRLARTSS